MKTVTYKELAAWINSLNEDQQSSNVTIFNKADDEYYPILECDIAVGTEIMDDNHPVLVAP